jgi:hypothetical protein
MNEIKIELKDGFSTIRDLYFRNGNESIFTYQKTKRPIFITSIFATLSIALYFIEFRYPDTSWIFIFIVCFLITIVGAFYLVINGRKYLMWKKKIDNYLEKLRKYKSQWLLLTPQTIEISNSDEITIERWETIKYVSIYPDFISMGSDNHGLYLFPKKSMESDQYTDLKDFIKLAMKNDLSKIQESAVV